MRTPEIDKKNATKDRHGNVTAKNQNGLDVNGKPRESDNKTWQFGDSLANIEPNTVAG